MTNDRYWPVVSESPFRREQRSFRPNQLARRDVLNANQIGLQYFGSLIGTTYDRLHTITVEIVSSH
jgi:hypothetical protein